MVDFPKYESYKDSGVEWLGEIPSHWDIKKLKFMVRIKNGQDYKAFEVQEPGYPVIGSGGRFAYASKYLFEGESVLLGRKGTIDKPLYVNGAFWTVDTMFYSKIYSNTFPKFFYYCASTIPFGYYSTNTAVPSMTQEALGNHIFTYPPIEEQKRIVEFLDRKTAEIDQAIAQKQRLIELLQEQKAILINQAVTKGLDPNVFMCDRGVEWIGAIPTHWGNARLKTLMKKMDQGWSPQCFAYQADVDQWGVLKVGCVNGYKFNPVENKFLPPNLKPNKQLEIQHEDILISRANTLELVGSAACALYPRKKLMLCDKLYRIGADKDKVIPEYFVLLLQTKIARQQIEIGANGASPSMQNIGQDVIKNLYVPIPPISEQRQILSLITDFGDQQEETKTSILKEIQLLFELKHSLISNAVTGKIKV